MKKDNWQLRLIRMLLLLSILVSIVLTAAVFKASGSRALPNRGSDQVTTPQAFWAAQYLVNDSKGNTDLVQGISAHNLKAVNQLLNTADLANGKVTTVSTSTLDNKLKTPDTMVLRYADLVPVKYFTKISGSNLSKGFNFDYVVLPLKHGHVAQFIDSRHQTVTTVGFRSFDYAQAQRLSQHLGNEYPAEFKKLNNQLMVSLPKEIRLKTYVYRSQQGNVDQFNAQLLGTASQFTTRQIESGTEYVHKYGGQKTTYDSVHQLLTFQDHLPGAGLSSYQQRLDTAADQLKLFKQILPKVSFFESRQNGTAFDFRTYIDQVPVFYDGDQAAATVALNTKDAAITATYRLTTLGLPLPSDQQKVTLPSTDAVVSQLDKAGQGSNYQQLIVAYHWQDIGDGVVELKPVWMVAGNDQHWYTLSQFLDQAHASH
ncbi:two-component system activity regulator YycH [Leuconostocaceae bacterium ESL0723]|nr:two-component system activity regulator YycH [Leuconostocaceae bacterium ESL0723]